MGAAVGRAGRFELREQIAESPRGPTFLARDPRRRVDVLIQRFTAPRPTDAWARYVEAVAAARRASVTGVELPLELVADDPIAPFAVLALRVGESVEALRRRTGALQWSRAAELVLRCAELLTAITAATGKSHRALHPSALWLAPNGELSLLDLGVAELGPSSSPPREGPVYVEYRAPEQLAGAPGDARSDVFTLGVLLCELSSGVHPFSGPSEFQAARKVLLPTPPSLSDVVRGMSPAAAREAERLIGEALAPRPDDRFQGAAEFQQSLEFARRIIGSPASPRSMSTAVVATPAPPARPVIEDPSTMLRIPRSHVVHPAAVTSIETAAPPVPTSAPSDDERTAFHERPPAEGRQRDPHRQLRDDERTIVDERGPARLALLRPHDPSIHLGPAAARRTVPLEPTLVLPGASQGADLEDVPTEALPRLMAPARPQRPVHDPDGTLILSPETTGTLVPQPRASGLPIGRSLLCALLLLVGVAVYFSR